jgi:hypothetical protein
MFVLVSHTHVPHVRHPAPSLFSLICLVSHHERRCRLMRTNHAEVESETAWAVVVKPRRKSLVEASWRTTHGKARCNSTRSCSNLLALTKIYKLNQVNNGHKSVYGTNVLDKRQKHHCQRIGDGRLLQCAACPHYKFFGLRHPTCPEQGYFASQL